MPRGSLGVPLTFVPLDRRVTTSSRDLFAPADVDHELQPAAALGVKPGGRALPRLPLSVRAQFAAVRTVGSSPSRPWLYEFGAAPAAAGFRYAWPP
jgi:hypothetical protein